MAYIYIEPKEKTYAKAYRVLKGVIPYNGTTVNISTQFPQIDYKALTSDDFIVSYVSDGNTDSWGWFRAPYSDTWYEQCNQLSFYKSYNANTGQLTVTPTNQLSNNYKSPADTGGYIWRNLTIEIIMIVDGIKSEYA